MKKSPSIRKRIAYNWVKDFAYTFIWSAIGSAVFVGVMHLFVAPQHDVLKSAVLLSFAITLPIGMRPVYSLFTIPDTLYLTGEKLHRANGEIIDIQNIAGLTVNTIGLGSGELQFYELELKKPLPSPRVKSRQSLVLVERYDLRYLLQTRSEILTIFKSAGLDQNRIKQKQVKWYHALGIRDRFKT